jgi:hypothetical protein
MVVMRAGAVAADREARKARKTGLRLVQFTELR